MHVKTYQSICSCILTYNLSWELLSFVLLQKRLIRGCMAQTISHQNIPVQWNYIKASKFGEFLWLTSFNHRLAGVGIIRKWVGKQGVWIFLCDDRKNRLLLWTLEIPLRCMWVTTYQSICIMLARVIPKLKTKCGNMLSGIDILFCIKNQFYEENSKVIKPKKQWWTL